MQPRQPFDTVVFIRPAKWGTEMICQSVLYNNTVQTPKFKFKNAHKCIALAKIYCIQEMSGAIVLRAKHHET